MGKNQEYCQVCEVPWDGSRPCPECSHLWYPDFMCKSRIARIQMTFGGWNIPPQEGSPLRQLLVYIRRISLEDFNLDVARRKTSARQCARNIYNAYRAIFAQDGSHDKWKIGAVRGILIDRSKVRRQRERAICRVLLADNETRAALEDRPPQED